MRCIVLLMLMLCSLSTAGCWQYAEGEKVGTIILVGKSGFFCKTWEATMVRGGFTDGTGVAGTTVSHFTIEDLRLLDTVQDALNKQQTVKVYFTEEVVSLCRSDSSSVFLKSIEVKS